MLLVACDTLNCLAVPFAFFRDYLSFDLRVPVCTFPFWLSRSSLNLEAKAQDSVPSFIIEVFFRSSPLSDFIARF